MELDVADWDKIDTQDRLGELDRYDLIDTSTEEAFDRVTRLVCRLFGVSMSTVTLIDGHRQWFKSRQGVSSRETDRRFSFCQVPTAEDRPLVVPDTREDARFRDNPLVTESPHLRFYAGVPIRSSRGLAIGTLCAMDVAPRTFSADELDLLADLGRLIETEFELRFQASTDSLTQTLSRRAFQREAERALALAVRHRHDLSCIMFDIDHFKQVNDENGHACGDVVLRQTAATARNQLRKSDIFGRVGGEEFAIILPHTSAANALKVAEKIRSAVAAEVVRVSDRALEVTASFGVAWLDKTSADVAALIEHADQAMYEAKAQGRNRSVLWQGSHETPAGLSRRVLKAGTIVFNNGRSVINCTVRRLSDIGARLDVIAPEGVPRSFKLSISADAFSRACTIVKRDVKQFEVVFE